MLDVSSSGTCRKGEGETSCALDMDWVDAEVIISNGKESIIAWLVKDKRYDERIGVKAVCTRIWNEV